DDLPVMEIPNIGVLPQALMLIDICEPRYRQMLSGVLESKRRCAVAGLNLEKLSAPDHFEPPHRVASVGIIRACQKNDNGTSNLLLQGLCRVEILKIIRDEPYRRIRIRALSSQAGGTPDENQ